MKDKVVTLGAPRTGFTLLSSIITELILYKNGNFSKSKERFISDTAIQIASIYLKNEFMDFFKDRIDIDNYIYNGEFDLLVGGPKWINPQNYDECVVRKYLGVKDEGDFTFLLYLPKSALEFNQVVHSHYNPKIWVEDSYYEKYLKFASIRNPMGTLNSSLFTINAITSEYITKYMQDFDEEDLREKMALYKSTDLNMFKGLVDWLKSYFEEFIPVKDKYEIVSWEEIIATPVETILRVASSLEIEIPKEDAQKLWDKLDHRNLLEYHNFNYRKGGGVVGEWKQRFTNHHLKILEDAGFNKYLEMFGYEKISYVDESEYTPYQKRVASYIEKGEVCNEIEDENLFIFNWNKSNIAQTSHKFDRFERTGDIQIERSALNDKKVAVDFGDYAHSKIALVQEILSAYEGEFDANENKKRFYESVISKASEEEIKRVDNRFEKIETLKREIDGE